MFPRVVLALSLLLLVPPSARAELETVVVSDHPGATYGLGLKLTFKPIRPDPALARFSVEESRAFMEALELAFQTPKPRTMPPSQAALHASLATGLNDPTNIVYLIAHQGPHPEEYHQEVYSRLETALGRCRSDVECRARLVDMLDKIAADICSPGSMLNGFLTKKS